MRGGVAMRGLSLPGCSPLGLWAAVILVSLLDADRLSASPTLQTTGDPSISTTNRDPTGTRPTTPPVWQCRPHRQGCARDWIPDNARVPPRGEPAGRGRNGRYRPDGARRRPRLAARRRAGSPA